MSKIEGKSVQFMKIILNLPKCHLRKIVNHQNVSKPATFGYNDQLNSNFCANYHYNYSL